jgi:hypothetical protein
MYTNIYLLDILTSKSHLCWHRHFPPGPSLSNSSYTQFHIQVFQAVKDASASQDTLIDLFNRIESFFLRLEIYTEVPPTVAMSERLVNIMVEVLVILGIATEELKRGRMSESIPRRYASS